MKDWVVKIIIGMLVLIPLSVTAFSWRDFWGNDEDFDVGSSPTATTETTIVNEVNVSASTGGNTVTSGAIQNGEVKASVKIKTEINGEVLEDFDENFSDDTNFEKEFEHATGTASTTTSIKVKTNDQSDSFPRSDLEKFQVRLEKNEDNTTSTIATTTTATTTKILPRHFGERISNWISKIFKNVFSIFKK